MNRPGSILGVLALVAVAVLACALGYREIWGPDIGYHMETGRRVLESRAFPLVEEFTYTRAGAVIQYMPWFYDVGLWLVFGAGGTLGVTLANITLTVFAMAMMVWRGWRDVGRISVFCAPLLALFALGNTWEVRPHVGSWVLLNIVLLAMEEWRRGRARAIWLVPPTMLVWVNTHSLYILGLVVLGAYGIEELLVRRRLGPGFIAAAAMSVVACAASPYGLRGLLYPVVQFGMLQGQSVFKSGVVGTAEFLPTFRSEFYLVGGRVALVQWILFVHLFAALALVGLVSAGRRMISASGLLCAAFGYIFWTANKNFGYFAIASLPMVVSGWERLAEAVGRRFAKGKASGGTGWIPRVVSGVSFVLCLIGALWLHGGYLYESGRSLMRTGHAFNERMLPVRSCRFLAERLPEGRILNSFGDGGYLRFATRRPVFIDGRSEIFGEAFYREYLLFDSATHADLLLAKWKPDIALVPYSVKPMWLRLFTTQPGWRCVYADDRDAIFVRDGFAADVPAMPPSEGGRGFPVFSDAEAREVVTRAAATTEPGVFFALSGHHYNPWSETNRAFFHLARNEADAAAGWALEGLRRSTFPAPDLLVNAGHALFESERRELARECYLAAVRYGPDEFVSRRLREIERGGAGPPIQ